MATAASAGPAFFAVSPQRCITPLHVFYVAARRKMIWIDALPNFAQMVQNLSSGDRPNEPFVKAGVNQGADSGVRFSLRVDVPIAFLETTLPYPTGAGIASVFNDKRDRGLSFTVRVEKLKSFGSLKWISAAALAYHTDSITGRD